jgi:peptidoglycan/LPS O-acetylase OafA/YrhL
MAILLLLLPLLAWLLWRWLRPEGGRPPRWAVILVAVAVTIGGAAALFVRLTDEDVVGGVYVPPSLGPDGRVLPSRIEGGR